VAAEADQNGLMAGDRHEKFDKTAVLKENNFQAALSFFLSWRPVAESLGNAITIGQPRRKRK